MNDAFNAAASAMMTTLRMLDFSSQNAANNRTPGFKPLSVSAKSFQTELDRRFDRDPTLVRMHTAHDFSQGVLNNSDNPLAAAIQGPGFFRIETPAGTRFTRNGDFMMSSTGVLQTRAGYSVLGAGGPIQGDPNDGPMRLGEDGRVYQAGQELGQISVVEFDDPQQLKREADTIFSAPVVAGERPARESTVSDGMLEMSPAPAMSSMVSMIAAGRAFEQAQRIISTLNQSYQDLLKGQG